LQKEKKNELGRKKKKKLDQRKLEVIQPKIKDKSNLRLGVFFFGKSKKASRRTVKGKKKKNPALNNPEPKDFINGHAA